MTEAQNELRRMLADAIDGAYTSLDDFDSYAAADAALEVFGAALLSAKADVVEQRQRIVEELTTALANYPLDVFPEPTGRHDVPDRYAASAMRTAYRNAIRIVQGEDRSRDRDG